MTINLQIAWIISLTCLSHRDHKWNNFIHYHVYLQRYMITFIYKCDMCTCVHINRTKVRVSFIIHKTESCGELEMSGEGKNYSVIAIPSFKEWLS